MPKFKNRELAEVMNGFKPEFGNEKHIKILRIADQIEQDKYKGDELKRKIERIAYLRQETGSIKDRTKEEEDLMDF